MNIVSITIIIFDATNNYSQFPQTFPQGKNPILWCRNGSKPVFSNLFSKYFYFSIIIIQNEYTHIQLFKNAGDSRVSCTFYMVSPKMDFVA